MRDMGSFSLVQWIIVGVYLASFVLTILALVRILRRTGYSGWWCILAFVPIANIIGLWIFSNASWPAVASNPAKTFE
ncbi:MAG: hypothetical protein WCO82_00485 [Sphingomonadales bacterium]